MSVLRRWWDRRTLHDRLALLVSGAVAAGVLLLAIGSWLVVAEIQQHRMQSELATDADAIAASSDQWLAASGSLPDLLNQRGDGHRGPHQLGPRWQILDASGLVLRPTTGALPVTEQARRVATSSLPTATRPRQITTRPGRAAEEEVTIGGDSYLMLTAPLPGGGAVQVAIDQDPDNHTLAIFGLLLALGCVLGVAVAALLGRTVARAGLVPVQRLTEAVEDVAVTMDLTRPIEISGADEIARLGTSVNTMLAAIDTARRSQRALVEDAGHELRTPLTSLRTNIELLLQVERAPELAHRLPPEERVKLLADLEAQVGELATLTTELVELAREETTREAVEPVEFADVVEAAIARVRTRAPGLTFAADLAAVQVLGRPGELERMVVNVLDNAAKFSPTGAVVRTGLIADGNHCVLTVADQGPGIDEADRPYVFDRFYRSVAARSTPGSGLGLAIVAQTAAQHQGLVSASPRNPSGTIVSIQLPLARVAAPAS